MKKFLLILLAALALQSSLTAMQPDQNERRVVQLNPEWRTENQVPDKITILEFDEPITDESLLRLNPDWKTLINTLSREKKSTILTKAYQYPGGDALYHVGRCLMALAVCIGADPDSTERYRNDTALYGVVFNQDYQLTKYLLEKGANPNQRGEVFFAPLQHAQNIALAELLITNKAVLTEKTALARCHEANYPATLLEFYLNQGIEPKPDENGWTALHKIAYEYKEDENQVKKAHLLLNTGLSQTTKNKWDEIALHSAALHKHKKICIAFINHHLEKHGRFLTLLACLKKEFPWFYKIKDVLKLLFQQGFDAMSQLRKLLNIKDPRGHTACDIWPIPELDPNTCTYEKYLKLKNTPPNL